jgi:integrase
LLLLLTRIFRSFTGTSNRSLSKATHQLSNAEYHLSLAELERLIAAASSPRDRLLMQLLVETGMRRSEVAALMAGDVDVSRNLIVIRGSKGNKTRLVPVRRKLAQALVALTPDLEDTLFRSRTGQALGARQINRIVAQAGVRADVRNPNPKYTSVTCHLLRHSFARHWKRASGSIESLSKILGHASVKTTWDLYGTESLADVQHNYETTLGVIFKSRQAVTTDTIDLRTTKRGRDVRNDR